MDSRDQIINDLKMRFPIDRRHKGQKIEGERRIIAQKTAQLDQLRGPHGHIEFRPSYLPLGFRDFLQAGKFGLNSGEKFGGAQATDSAFFLAAASMLYAWIFF